VAAHEDELEPLVGEGGGAHVCLPVSVGVGGRGDPLLVLEQASLGGQRPVSADAVDRPVAGGGDQPADRVGGLAVAGPALGGDGERLLRGFLGEVDIAEEADQRSEDPAPLIAEDLIEDQ
jgi:hypothetical protein